MKISSKNSKEKLFKCATKVARLHKVSIQIVHKLGHLGKFNRCREIELNFLTADYLYETWHTCSSCSWLQKLSQFFKFLPWDLVMVSKSKEMG